MLSLEATKEQKIYLAIIGGCLIIFFAIYIFILPIYNKYKKIKLDDKFIADEIEQQYREVIRLKSIRDDYFTDQKYLQDAKSKLKIEGSNILTTLTKTSPINNFFHSSLEMENKKENKDDFSQYPFEIGFIGDFNEICEYLHYQESELPLSVINKLEIKTTEYNSSLLETNLSGIIFKVN